MATINSQAISQLAQEIGQRLTRKAQFLAVAESCTGGQICHELTNISGSSGYFRGGVVAYANDIKIKLLKVPAEVIERHGAVSAQCVEYMAGGVAELFECQYGIGVSGIAGPGGGSAQKPVGTVFIAVKSPSSTKIYEHRFNGNRREIKKQAVRSALEHLLDVLDAE